MKNINIVNRTVATKLGLDLDIVEKVNKAYWKEIVNNLKTASEEPVHIKKIGTISASPYKVNSHIKLLINQIRKVKKSSKYRPVTRDRYLNQYYTELKTTLIKRNQLAIELNILRTNQKKKQINEHTSIPKTDSSRMEEQGESSRGDNK